MKRKPFDHGASTTARGYGYAWQRLRERILKRDRWLCQACKREGRTVAATNVDHILNKRRGGTDDPGNLESLCDWHKTVKDAADRGEREPLPPLDLSGWGEGLVRESRFPSDPLRRPGRGGEGQNLGVTFMLTGA